MPREFGPQPNAPITREGGYASQPMAGYLNQFDLVEENVLIGRWAGAGVGPFQWVTLGTGLELAADGVLSSDGLGGDVVGPAGATDNFVALWNGATGLLLKNSAINGAWFDQSVAQAASPLFAALALGAVSSGANLSVRGGSLATAQFAASVSVPAGGSGRLLSGGGSETVAAYHNWFDSQAVEVSAGSTATFVSGVTIAPRSYAGTNGEGIGFWTRSVERCHVSGAGLFTFAAGVATNALSVNGFALTVNGAPTLNDWFDQSVKAAASPAFAALTIGALTLNTFALTLSAASALNQNLRTTDSPSFDNVTVTNAVNCDTVDATSDIDAPAYFVGGTPGANFSGAVTNITVVNGIVTAAS